MSNKTKDILDEILDIEETTAELVEAKPSTLTIKRDNTLGIKDLNKLVMEINKLNLKEYANLISIINKHRNIIYSRRDNILNSEDIHENIKNEK